MLLSVVSSGVFIVLTVIYIFIGVRNSEHLPKWVINNRTFWSFVFIILLIIEIAVFIICFRLYAIEIQLFSFFN